MADTGLKHETWLERVPTLLDECVAEWELRLGAPYEAGVAGYTVRADLPDGTHAVLKLIYPHREAEQEAEALRAWNGDGAIRLLAHDADRWAILIERCEPGTQLAELPPDEGPGGGDRPAPASVGPGRRAVLHAGGGSGLVAELPPRRVGEDRAAVRAEPPRRGDGRALRRRRPSQGEHVLLHQDLHGDNVLAAQREPWLVIDPKPLVGEREFAVAPIVRDFELGETRE